MFEAARKWKVNKTKRTWLAIPNPAKRLAPQRNTQWHNDIGGRSDRKNSFQAQRGYDYLRFRVKALVHSTLHGNPPHSSRTRIHHGAPPPLRSIVLRESPSSSSNSQLSRRSRLCSNNADAASTAQFLRLEKPIRVCPIEHQVLSGLDRTARTKAVICSA